VYQHLFLSYLLQIFETKQKDLSTTRNYLKKANGGGIWIL